MVASSPWGQVALLGMKEREKMSESQEIASLGARTNAPLCTHRYMTRPGKRHQGGGSGVHWEKRTGVAFLLYTQLPAEYHCLPGGGTAVLRALAGIHTRREGVLQRDETRQGFRTAGIPVRGCDSSKAMGGLACLLLPLPPSPPRMGPS